MHVSPLQLARTTDPTEEPVSVVQLRGHLREDSTDQDDQITSYIQAAREELEERTRRGFVTQSWTLKLPCFSDSIILPRAPLQSVTSITYIDEDGASQTLASDQYTVLASTLPGRIIPAYDVTYPTHRAQTDAITIEYVVGYGAASSVPERIKQAIRLLAAHWYENREAVITGTTAALVPLAVERLVDSFIVREVA